MRANRKSLHEEPNRLANMLQPNTMADAVFTPKQLAKALGVSESSVKRWIDSGKLQAAKTVGGHRKISLPVVAEFVRKTGKQLVDPAVLGMVTTPRFSLASAVDELFRFLLAGDEAACRELVLGFFQRGESIADLGDQLIGPVFSLVGLGWERGSVKIFEERRACEVMIAVLHELRRWLPTPPQHAPLAVVATPEQDFAEVPARLVELTLAAAGWRVSMAGSGLPFDEVVESVRRQRPRLLCLSVTHADDRERFIAECNSTLIRPVVSLLSIGDGKSVHVVAGGRALCCDESGQLECNLIATGLADLVSYQATMLADAG